MRPATPAESTIEGGGEWVARSMKAIIWSVLSVFRVHVIHYARAHALDWVRTDWSACKLHSKYYTIAPSCGKILTCNAANIPKVQIAVVTDEDLNRTLQFLLHKFTVKVLVKRLNETETITLRCPWRCD